MNNNGTENGSPAGREKRFFYFVWRNLPRLALLGVLLLIVVLAFVIGGEKKRLEEEKAAARAPEAPPVNTIVLELRPRVMHDSVNLPGLIEPWAQVAVPAKVNGTVVEIVAREGSFVEKGDVLVRLEEDDYRIALAAAEAAYEQAQADVRRGESMVRTKAIPEADLQRLRTALATARANLDNARLRLSRCTITAPMRGVVDRITAEVGMYLGVGDPIGRMLDIDRVKAVVGIPESDVDAVRRVSEVTFTIQALGERAVTGKKHFLASEPESVARVYRLELEVDNPDRSILPGMFIRAEVVKQTLPDSLAVPLYSIISRNEEQFVFVVRDGVAVKKPVSLGIIEGWMVRVTGGLAAGEQVIVEGHRDVEDGQPVKVLQVITDPEGLRL